MPSASGTARRQTARRHHSPIRADLAASCEHYLLRKMIALRLIRLDKTPGGM
jgi:hypothetical protein